MNYIRARMSRPHPPTVHWLEMGGRAFYKVGECPVYQLKAKWFILAHHEAKELLLEKSGGSIPAFVFTFALKFTNWK